MSIFPPTTSHVSRLFTPFHCHSHAGGLPLKLSFNREARLNEDPLIQKVEDAVSVFGQIVTPGIFLVNTYPFRECLIESGLLSFCSS